ncbi:hypothetical protein A5844_002052 [Enterococcus sp. 10A9_DIV0425]|uniref:Uncharacterized protein n=3 Tax=Candidatus Enterococcus wittei TaxID=1987383 RepID=A0A242JYP6_9ENTE|nr:hypothetical protein [Enterococcus sp. 10A9_DIV0425]OTP10352.1 hypothetical protein A5844_002052 [Enterococcus sp. 10A9_DIV0425]THE09370.1 hypothetical protein E1H99_11150 [Enterococcus hirae]
MNEHITKQDEQKKKRLLLLLFFAMLLAVAGGVWYHLSSKPVAIVSASFPDGRLAKDMKDDELKKYMDELADASSVTINVYPSVEVEADGTTATIRVQNLPTNTTGQQAILLNADTGEELMKSGMILPGQEIANVSLDKALDPGAYKGNVKLEFYDLEAKKKVGETSVGVDITVHS